MNNPKPIDPVEQRADARAKAIVDALHHLFWLTFVGLVLVVLLICVQFETAHEVQPVYIVNQPGQAPTLPYNRPYPAP